MTDYSATEIKALIKADQDHYLHPTSSISVLMSKGPKIITRGKGCKVWDINGQRIHRRHRRPVVQRHRPWP